MKRSYKYLPVIAISVLSIAVTLVVFAVVRVWESDKFRAEFSGEAKQRVSALRRGLELSLNEVESLGAFYDSSEVVTRREFASFTTKQLSNLRYIQALEWIPRVAGPERDEYERRARAEGLRGFQFTERESQGVMVRAGQLDEYFPVYYLEPYEGNEDALGFDLASEQTRLEALTRSRDTGKTAVSARITLVQEKAGQFGFLVFRPVYKSRGASGNNGSGAELAGFALGVFRIGELVDKSLSYAGLHDIDVYVYDHSAGDDRRFLYAFMAEGGPSGTAQPDEKALQSGIYYESLVDVGDREWLIICKPTEGLLSTFNNLQSWGVLVAGLFMTTIVTAYIKLVVDRSEEGRRHARELERRAFYDELTGLPNRALLTERLNRAIKRAHRDDSYSFALLYLDLDRFKYVNDSLGHMAGDELLVITAGRLSKCTREIDTVSRLGGDEFAVLLEGIRHDKYAMLVADRIQEVLSAPFKLHGNEVFTSASIGIAFNSPEYRLPEEILRDADTAMYSAKASGRSRYEIFDKDMHAEMLNTLSLEADLRHSIKKQELELFYQPIVSLEENRIVGAEALVRWHHPERGLVLPGLFIPLAEETGFIVQMGEWVIRTAFSQLREWHQAGHDNLRICINLSVRQFKEDSLAPFLQEQVEKNGLRPGAVEIEITESMAIEDPDQIVRVLGALSAMGIRISLDDFGTGFASLSTLKRFPINTIKIDGSFMVDVLEHKDAAELVRAIAAMAHIFGLNIIAEGVETEEQMEFLCSTGCEEMQGFLFSRAVPAREFTAMLQSGYRLKGLPKPRSGGGKA